MGDRPGSVAAAALLADPAALRMRIAAERARRSGSRSFAAFVQQAWPHIPGSGALKWNPYLDGLCAVLEALMRRRIRRLVGNGPPRNGKSNVFAILLPAWVWTWNPKEEFIFISFSDTLVKEHSIKCRDVIESQWYREAYRPSWVLRADRNTQNDFENTAGGRRIASTMKGAGLTGRGGNFIGIDDPLSVEEAKSEAARLESTRIVEQVVLSRFNDAARGVAAMLAQRVAFDDPTKYAISRGWTQFVVPLEMEEPRCVVHDDAGAEVWRDNRELGAILSPERFDEKSVAEIKSNLVKFATQFQQRPLQHMSAGLYFKRIKFQYVDVAPIEVAARVRRWDLASTEGGGDWTVGALVSRLKDGRFCVEDVVRGQWGPRDVRAMVKATAERDGDEVEIVMDQDPGQAGKDQMAEYSMLLAGYTLRYKPVTRDKETNAGPASSQVEAGNVLLVRAPWNEPFIQTLEAFPDKAVHDDDVDAFSGAVSHLALVPMSTFEMWGQADLDGAERDDGWNPR